MVYPYSVPDLELLLHPHTSIVVPGLSCLLPFHSQLRDMVRHLELPHLLFVVRE
jgi:hypothetical protein